MDPPSGGVMRNLPSKRKIMELMSIMPDTHWNLNALTLGGSLHIKEIPRKIVPLPD